jgi:hypothetical protein
VSSSPRALPRPGEVSTDQFRGRACIWCSARLDENAVDLGERKYRSLDRVRTWYPRACGGC